MPVGAYATQQVVAGGVGNMSGSIPADAYEILGLYIVLIPTGDAPDWTLELITAWCGNGEGGISGMVDIAGISWSLSNGIIFNVALDIPTWFTDGANVIAPGDTYGVMMMVDALMNTIDLLGTVVRYKVGYPVQGGLGMIRHQFYPCQTWTP